ncbi:MAG: hypothetical protein K5777_08340 [Nitrosopumilus sp.]|nr:hypothetical protein [Nitrosopumilus sp.]
MKNEELFEHLCDSVYYLIKYSEKYSIPLPKKSALLRMISRADNIASDIHQPKGNTKKNNQQDNSTILKVLVRLLDITLSVFCKVMVNLDQLLFDK